MKIPTTIITGYLGSGKTTLLRNIVKNSPLKIAILMNEFGDISIDGKVVKGENITMTELSGGCVCCSLSGELEAAINEIVNKIKPQWIVIETTGVAEPTALANDILENITVVKLDSIITLVDTEAMIKYPKIGHTGLEQIQVADILLLNKIDLIKAEEIELVKKKIGDINQKAIKVETKQANVDINLLFGLNFKHITKKVNKHKSEFEQFDYSSEKKLNELEFTKIIQNLPKGIYRCKGFVKFEEKGVFLNHVAGRSSYENFDVQKNELVFIGKNIEKYKRKIKSELIQIET